MIYLLILIITGAIIYSVFIEPYNFKIKKIPVLFKNLPKKFKGEEILQISDLHIKKFGHKEKRLLKFIKKLKPKSLIITGDIVDCKTKSLKACENFFKELSRLNIKNIFAVFGNHIHTNNFINNYNLKKLLKDHNVKILINDSFTFEKGGDKVNIIGVDDPRTGHDDLKKAFKNINNKDTNIVLSHSMELIEKVDLEDIDIILTGHTHGGQIKIPFIPAFWIPHKYKGKYISGLYKIKSLLIYINPGIATVKLPIRFNARPEITLFKLNKK